MGEHLMRQAPLAELGPPAGLLWKGLAAYTVVLDHEAAVATDDTDLQEIEGELQAVWPISEFVRTSHPLSVPHYLQAVLTSFLSSYQDPCPPCLLVCWPYPRNWFVSCGIGQNIADRIEQAPQLTAEASKDADALRRLVVFGNPAGEEEDGLLQSVLLHELGHVVLKASSALQAELLKVVLPKTSNTAQTMCWAEELVADLLAVHMGGPAVLHDLREALPPQQASATHPPTSLRVAACAEGLKAWGWHDPSVPSDFRAQLPQATPISSISGFTQPVLTSIVNAINIVFPTPCGPGTIFAGSYASIQDWPASFEVGPLSCVLGPSTCRIGPSLSLGL
jgi:hypothetical protein